MQTNFAEFFRGRVGPFDFEIVDVEVDDETFRELMRLGGRCGLRTLRNVVHDPSCGLDRLVAVWASVADKEELTLGLKHRGNIFCLDCSLHVDKLIFVMDTIGVPAGRIRLSGQSSDWTVELAEFILDRKIESPRGLLRRMAFCCHMDIAELLIPRCSMEDLANVLQYDEVMKNDIHELIKRTIVERTHPMLKWLCSSVYVGW